MLSSKLLPIQKHNEIQFSNEEYIFLDKCVCRIQCKMDTVKNFKERVKFSNIADIPALHYRNEIIYINYQKER